MEPGAWSAPLTNLWEFPGKGTRMKCPGETTDDSCAAAETPFDRVTAVAAALFGAPISTISTIVGEQMNSAVVRHRGVSPRSRKRFNAPTRIAPEKTE